jgi:hypothetical protein
VLHLYSDLLFSMRSQTVSSDLLNNFALRVTGLRKLILSFLLIFRSTPSVFVCKSGFELLKKS